MLTELLALDDEVLFDRVCGFTAEERAALHKPAMHAWERYRWRDDLDGRKDKYSPQEGRRLDVIVMAAAPADQLFWPQDERQLRVVRSRGSRFLTALARHVLHTMATRDFFGAEFDEIRRFERDGLVTLDADDDYVLAMVNRLGGRSSGGGRRADLLRADPDLLARVFWRIFEVEGNPQVSLANVDKYGGARVQSWHDAVLDLLSDATIDRSRVLDATVAALGLGFPQYRAGWYSRLHTALAPSIDERAAHQDGYATLLRSSVGSTVALAVDALTALEKAGRLDHDRIADGLAAAVLVPAKSTAIKALALAARAGVGQSSVAAALGHPHPDVQAAAVQHLRSRGEREPVLAALPALAPAVAAAARQWLGDEAPPAATVPVAAPDVAAPVPELRAVAPITDPAELVEAFAILLADPTDAELLERALCAAARLGTEPGEYAGLARRAARLLRDAPAYEWDLLLDVVAGVVFAAARTRPVRDLPRLPAHSALLVGRAAAVASALRSGRRYAPCAEPTHTGGWIEPGVLVRRLSTGPAPDPLDAVAALLRLGPDPAAVPSAVRDAAAAVPGAMGAALRYALGGPPPAAPDFADRPLWIAAARARTPRGDDAPLLGWGPDYDAAGAGPAPGWRVWFDAERQYSQIQVSALGPAAPGLPDPALPTVTLSAVDSSPASGPTPGAPWHPWLASMWPGNIEPLLAITLPRQLWSVGGSVDGGAGAHALRLLSDTVVELPPLSPFTVAAGLAGPTLSDRVAAVDAAAALLPHRLSPEALAAAMATLAPTVPLNRWASALADLAAAGRGAQVRAVLTTLLPSLDRSARGLYALVELLRDEQLRAGAPVTAPALRQWLAAATGTSKTAVAARSLLA